MHLLPSTDPNSSGGAGHAPILHAGQGRIKEDDESYRAKEDQEHYVRPIKIRIYRKVRKCDMLNFVFL